MAEKNSSMGISRREVIKGMGMAAGAGLLGLPVHVGAQAQEPIRIGTLCPLTGAGGVYGPNMQKIVTIVADKINSEGGINGHPIRLFHEDGQTNPDAAVRGCRKLIDVNKVIAVLSTWSSAVTLAIAPICIENKVFSISVSGAVEVTELKHDGYVCRTQPTGIVQGEACAQFTKEKGVKRVAYMALQHPAAKPFGEAYQKKVTSWGGALLDSLTYEANKASYRSEITRTLSYKPEMIMVLGFQPDCTILVRELYKAGYKGMLLGTSYSFNQKLADDVGEAAEGIYNYGPAPDFGSPSYAVVEKLLAIKDPDPYVSQSYDHINLVALALAAGKDYTGTGIKTNLRKISNPPGVVVHNFEEGMAQLKKGQKINYDGVSGPCDFDEKGDVVRTQFLVQQVKKGKFINMGMIKL
jgi:branched-chain amino acid transport system substrate-binding protein